MYCLASLSAKLLSMPPAKQISRFWRRCLLFVSIFAYCLIGGHVKAGQTNPTHSQREESVRFTAAEFHQNRHIKVLARPLVSSGTVELSERGFDWKQTAPYEIWLIYDGTSILERTRIGGQETTKEVLDPIVNGLTRTLFLMLSGSLSSIEIGFEIQQQVTDSTANWHYVLIPRDVEIRGIIPRIEIAGGRYLDRIRVEESQGNFTLIELSGHRPNE